MSSLMPFKKLVGIDFAKDKKTTKQNGHFFDIGKCMDFGTDVFLHVSKPFIVANETSLMNLGLFNVCLLHQLCLDNHCFFWSPYGSKNDSASHCSLQERNRLLGGHRGGGGGGSNENYTL